jgi:hypothetical protein
MERDQTTTTTITMMLCFKNIAVLVALAGSTSAFSSTPLHSVCNTKQVFSFGPSRAALGAPKRSPGLGATAAPSEVFFGYDKIDPNKETFSVEVVDVIDAPVSQVFKLASDWSKDSPYWKKQISGDFISVKESDKLDLVGTVRKYVMNSREYSDVLLNADEENYKMAYGVLSASPPLLKGAVTYASFKPLPGNNLMTKVTWSVVFQPVYSFPSLVSLIKGTQRKGYQEHINTLKSFFASDTRSAVEKIGGGAFLIANDIGQKIMEVTTNMVCSKDGEPWEYDSYTDDEGALPKFCKILPATAAIMPARTGQIFQRNMEFVYSQTPLVGFAGELQGITAHPETAIALAKLPGGDKVVEICEKIMKVTVPEQVALTIELEGLLGTPEVTAALANTPGKNLVNVVQKIANDPFLAPFTGLWFPEPTTVINNLKNPDKRDLELAAQLIRGVNPMKITLAKKTEDLPVELRELKDTLGRSVEELIAAKSLFFCDYWEVATGDYNKETGVYFNQAKGVGGIGTVGDMKFWYAPRLAVYKNEDGKLDVLGFVLTRFEDKPNVVYSKESTPPNLYSLAKLHLTCADNQHHQFVSHLGMAHLNMEPFAVANNNAFPTPAAGCDKERHPIGRLLHPHFQDTIGINFLARQTLVSTVAPFTDATFSPGTVNAMEIFSRAFQVWDFFGDNFVGSLKARGFDEDKTDELEGYYYREDGFLVWNAMKKHFERVVEKLYNKSDREVANDHALQAWCHEVRDPRRGGIGTFPAKIRTKEMLVEVLTTIVFYCSAQHAAVNFSQLDYVAYVPNRPDSLRLAMVEQELPPGPGVALDIGEDVLYSAMPSFVNGEFQALFAFLLSTPPDNSFHLYKNTGDDLEEETDMFLVDLKEIHEAIKERNDKLVADGDMPYTYLDPWKIPQSINI